MFVYVIQFHELVVSNEAILISMSSNVSIYSVIQDPSHHHQIMSALICVFFLIINKYDYVFVIHLFVSHLGFPFYEVLVCIFM